MTTQTNIAMRLQDKTTGPSLIFGGEGAAAAIGRWPDRIGACARSIIELVREASVVEVCELLDAAGALSLADIAGGLDVRLDDVASVVRAMVADGSLREDEWGRYKARWA